MFEVTTNILERIIFTSKRNVLLTERSGAVLSKLWNTLNALSSKKPLKYTLYLSAIIIFFALILVPPIIGILTKAGSLQNVFDDPALMNTAFGAIATSFIIGLVVAALDFWRGFRWLGLSPGENQGG